MAVTFFLRRRNKTLSTSMGVPVYEYLFLTCESIETVGDENIVAPTVPGASAPHLTGETSPNFMFNLGAQRPTIRVSGFLLPIETNDFPTLTAQRDAPPASNKYQKTADNVENNPYETVATRTTATGNHYYLIANSTASTIGAVNGGVGKGAVGPTTAAVYQSARDLRHVLFTFWADQAGNFDQFDLGWPDWWGYGSGNGANVINGVTYRIWQGMMRQPRVQENAGEIDQYPYSLAWMIGKST